MSFQIIYRLLSPMIPVRIVEVSDLMPSTYREIRILFSVEEASQEECLGVVELLNKQIEEKYHKLLGFVKAVSKNCCALCDCLACDAVDVLKSINEFMPNDTDKKV